MKILCPTCRTLFNLAAFRCANGHQFQSQDGVLNLLDDTMTEQLDAIYHHLKTNRRDLPEIIDYNALPHTLAQQHHEWRLRSYDVDLVMQLLGKRRQQSILEISPWNGWLSHHLAKAGHLLTAVDYFAHPDEGLGAKRHYDADWQTIQMDLTDMTILQSRFDIVIINHGLHFSPDPVAHIIQARDLVLPGGLLIILNATFYRNPANRIEQVESMVDEFFNDFGLPIFLKPTRGYMDFAVKVQLEGEGIRFRAYRNLLLANLKALILRTNPSYYYGVHRVPK